MTVNLNVNKLLVVVAILALISSVLMAGEGCQGGKLIKGADGKIHKVQPKSSCNKEKVDLGTNTSSSKFDTSDFLPLDDNEPDNNSSK